MNSEQDSGHCRRNRCLSLREEQQRCGTHNPHTMCSSSIEILFMCSSSVVPGSLHIVTTGLLYGRGLRLRSAWACSESDCTRKRPCLLRWPLYIYIYYFSLVLHGGNQVNPCSNHFNFARGGVCNGVIVLGGGQFEILNTVHARDKEVRVTTLDQLLGLG